jgi:putative FmdB family regulatory protein
MPTYEYQCKTCGHHFDRVQRFSDDPVKECPECGAEVRRVIHPAGVIFKGAGWYITDSRKGGGESASLNAANGTKGEGESAKTDTKSTEKAEKTEPVAKAAATSES